MHRSLAPTACLLMLASCGDAARVEQVDRGAEDGPRPEAAERIRLDAADAGTSDAEASGETIMDVLRGDERFSVLAAAAEAAGLQGTLERGDYTVFAPTDEAFAALPEGTLDALMSPENERQLASVLRYHVVEGEKPARGIRGRNVLRTVSGEPLDVTETSGRFRVGGETGAVVVETDLPARNGVVHAIDAVLLPPPA